MTIFSAPNYCNEFDNDGAMLRITDKLCCCFYKLNPAEKAINKAKPKFAMQWGKNKRPGTPRRF